MPRRAGFAGISGPANAFCAALSQVSESAPFNSELLLFLVAGGLIALFFVAAVVTRLRQTQTSIHPVRLSDLFTFQLGVLNILTDALFVALIYSLGDKRLFYIALAFVIIPYLANTCFTALFLRNQLESKDFVQWLSERHGPLRALVVGLF